MRPDPMLSVELERAGEEDVVNMIFNRRDSRMAARTFLDWLKDKDGRCLKEEMSQFSNLLASGRLGCRLSRTNFYKSILAKLVGLGLISKALQYDHETGRALKVYAVVYQPVGKRKPLGPSFAELAHILCQKWNTQTVGR